MSKKIIILNGSPRKAGNTTALTAEFKKGAEEAGIKGNQMQMIDAHLVQLGDGLPGHGLGHIDEQDPGSGRNLLQLPELAPAEGDLHGHDLAVHGHMAGHFLCGTVGIGGHHEQVCPGQDSHGRSVLDIVDGYIRIGAKQAFHIFAVGPPGPGVQTDNRNTFFFITFSSSTIYLTIFLYYGDFRKGIFIAASCPPQAGAFRTYDRKAGMVFAVKL